MGKLSPFELRKLELLSIDPVRNPSLAVGPLNLIKVGARPVSSVGIGGKPPRVSQALDDAFEPVKRDGKTVIVPLECAVDFYDQVGKNTGYVINPEECLADNFAIAICGTNKPLPNPELSERIIKVICNEAK